MALTISPKQAFGFIPSRGCGCNSRYCQPWQADDSFMLQGKVTAAHFDNLISDGEFDSITNWQCGVGWSVSGGNLNATDISGTVATSIAPIGLIEGRLYLIQVAVDVTSVGSAGANEGFIIKINNQALALPGGATAYRNDLTATWLYRAGAITTDVIQFSTNESTIDFSVNYIRVYEVSELGMALYDDNGQIDDITSFTGENVLKHYFNGEEFTGTSAVWETNTAIQETEILWELFVNTWESLTYYTGCFTVRFYDTAFALDRIRNGDFEIDMGDVNIIQYWTNGSHWTRFDSGGGNHSAKFTGDGSGSGIAIYQKVWALGGGVYDLQFTYLGKIHVTAVINGVTTVDLGSFSALGTQTIEVDLSSYTGKTSVRITFAAVDLNDDFGMDNISFIAQEHDHNYVTNCINLQEEHSCTLLFYAVNLDNAFGFDYTTGALRHYLRVYGKIKHAGYPEERDDFLFSDNSRELLYARSEKEFEVTIGDAPESVHDCLAIMRLHDIFKINDDAYIPSGNYELKQRKSSDNSQAVFSVKETQGVGANYSCS